MYFTCVPTPDNKVDLTLKDIENEYFKLLNLLMLLPLMII